MRFKRLRSDAELEQFRASFLKSVPNSELGLPYLRASFVFGVIDRQDRLVAGYILGTREPMRLLDFVPEEKRADLVVPFGFSWSDCCEITCAWKSPEVSLVFMSARFWPHALTGVLMTGRKLLLGHNQSARLDQFYTTIGPATIYSGISAYGLPSRLFAYGRARVIISIIGLWIYETPRRFLKKLFKGGSK